MTSGTTADDGFSFSTVKVVKGTAPFFFNIEQLRHLVVIVKNSGFVLGWSLETIKQKLDKVVNVIGDCAIALGENKSGAEGKMIFSKFFGRHSMNFVKRMQRGQEIFFQVLLCVKAIDSLTPRSLE